MAAAAMIGLRRMQGWRVPAAGAWSGRWGPTVPEGDHSALPRVGFAQQSEIRGGRVP